MVRVLQKNKKPKTKPNNNQPTNQTTQPPSPNKTETPQVRKINK